MLLRRTSNKNHVTSAIFTRYFHALFSHAIFTRYHHHHHPKMVQKWTQNGPNLNPKSTPKWPQNRLQKELQNWSRLGSKNIGFSLVLKGKMRNPRPRTESASLRRAVEVSFMSTCSLIRCALVRLPQKRETYKRTHFHYVSS